MIKFKNKKNVQKPVQKGLIYCGIIEIDTPLFTNQTNSCCES